MTRLAAAPGERKGKSELEETFAKHVLWRRLPPPEREYRFHPIRMWRFDFAWPASKVAVEIEGGTWIKGGHSRGTGMEQDAVKYNEAAILGWLVIRATNHMVNDGRAIGFAIRALFARAAS